MSYETAAAAWRAEIEVEAERLITLGVPPWDALIQARQRIERRRWKASNPSPLPGETSK